MWPLPPLKNELVSFIFDQDHLACVWLRQTKAQPPLLTLQAYQRVTLENMCDQASITNPTGIVKHINAFLHDHRIDNSFATFALSPSHITQKYITLTHATPTPTDFALTTEQHINWEYDYLYPTDTNKYVFYLCGINHPILLQYKLIAMRTSMNLLSISTQDIALLQVYQHMHGDAFRNTQLALDMIAHDNKPQALFTDESIQRIVHIPPDIHLTIKQENPFLLTAAGLYLAQGIP
jgi:hypothetical protein